MNAEDERREYADWLLALEDAPLKALEERVAALEKRVESLVRQLSKEDKGKEVETRRSTRTRKAPTRYD